ncbi:MAG: NADH-quinone oxidoreductase subunit N [Vicingaceae bacterium]
MNIMDAIVLLRNEALLTLLVLVLIVAEIASGDHKRHISYIALTGMLIISITSLFSTDEGILFGGMFLQSDMTQLMKGILNIGTFIVILQSVEWVSKDENIPRTSEYYALMISTLIGMSFLISSGDFIMFFIGLELATLPLAALASFEVSQARSAEAGIKMIMSAAFSSGISLMGISMLYGLGGSIYFSELSFNAIASPMTILAMVLFFTGLAFKISLVPFHFWTADVYEGAPINISSYFSVMSKGAALFILLIILMKVFSAAIEIWQPLIYIISVVTMTVGNLFALRQQNIKRFLAFSSIAQAGFIVLGLYSGDSAGLNASVYFMLVYVFSNLGAFGVATIISNKTGKENIEDYNGLYKTNPGLSLVMLVSLFSLAGIPPLAGFFGKFFLFASAASQGSYVLVLIATLNATLSLYYYLLVVKAMFINGSDNPIPTIGLELFSKLALIICIIGMVAIGFFGQIHDEIQEIADKFL